MSAGVLSARRCDSLTRVFVLKLSQVIDILVHDNPQVITFVVRRDVTLGECFGHGWAGERGVKKIE
jgi:hypothetical protein